MINNRGKPGRAPLTGYDPRQLPQAPAAVGSSELPGLAAARARGPAPDQEARLAMNQQQAAKAAQMKAQGMPPQAGRGMPPQAGQRPMPPDNAFGLTKQAARPGPWGPQIKAPMMIGQGPQLGGLRPPLSGGRGAGRR